MPCGVADHGVTSLVDLGLPVTLADVDVALKAAFEDVFGPAEFFLNWGVRRIAAEERLR